MAHGRIVGIVHDHSRWSLDNPGWRGFGLPGASKKKKKKIVHPASKKATSYFPRRMLDFASSAQNGLSVDFWTVTENGQI